MSARQFRFRLIGETAMEFRLVVAIIRTHALEPVEKRLQEMGVRGLTVIRARGFGASPNLFSRD